MVNRQAYIDMYGLQVDPALDRIDELEREARLVLETIKAHETATFSCDQDGNEYCDCLDHATARLWRVLGKDIAINED